MNKDRIIYLLDRNRLGLCSDSENEELNKWFHTHNPGKNNLDNWVNETGGLDKLSTAFYDDFKQRTAPAAKIIPLKRITSLAVASLLLFLVGYLFYKPQKNKINQVADLHFSKHQIKPGTDKAVLTLANGSKIILNSAVNGRLAMQSNVHINKVTNGSISYKSLNQDPDNKQLVYNTMTTPRGGKFTLVLSDGTEVTLDAESSITYPVAFSKNERRVQVTGQAYFKVVHNAEQPFRVSVKGQTIEDVGTAFNVSAYNDDPSVKVTLAEGLVNVSNPLKTASLLPGQQAVIDDGQQNIAIKNVNVSEIVAWKDGWFVLHNESIKSVMKQAARWYDVDVEFKGKNTSKKLGGMISRYKDIADLLENLKITGGTDYKIEGRRVILTD